MGIKCLTAVYKPLTPTLTQLTQPMKKYIITLIALIYSISQVPIMAQPQIPTGKLIGYEESYLSSGDRKLLDVSALLGKDGKTRSKYYDYYKDFDTLTVIVTASPLDSIQKIIEKDIPSILTNNSLSDTNKDRDKRVTLIFDSGDTIRYEGAQLPYSFSKVDEYMKSFVVSQRCHTPLTKILGRIPSDKSWLNGVYWTDYFSRKNLTTTRYQYGNEEILVTRQAKTGKVKDIWVDFDGGNNKIEAQFLDILNGVYQNETGYSVFGEIDGQKYNSYDPGKDIRVKFTMGEKGIVFSDTIHWGFNRIQRVNAPPGAPPGWGGAGAFTGPSVWKVDFEKDELHVLELEEGTNAPTYPPFGKDFKLKKVRGPYAHTPDAWAMATDRPLTRGQLSLLTPELLKEILAEMKRRHADGSRLYPMEQLNKELIETIIEERTPKQATQKTSTKKTNSKKTSTKKTSTKKKTVKKSTKKPRK